MSNGEKDPPLPNVSAPLPKMDGAAPNTTPSLPDDDAPASEKHPVARAVPAPTNDNVVPLPVKRAAFDKYIVKASTKRLMMRVIRAHVSGKARKGLREELYYRALIEAIEAVDRGKGPKSWETVDGWTSTVTAHAISHYFRKEAVDMKWLNRDADAEEQPADPPEDLYGEEAWLIKPWLEEQVKDDAADRELFDLLCQTAREEKTFKQVAGERGLTQTALSNRIYRFKMKYLPKWHRHKERERAVILLLVFAALGLAALVALVVFLLLPWLAARNPPPPAVVPPSEPVPVLAPPPAPQPTQFNQAAPTDGGSNKAPLKP